MSATTTRQRIPSCRYMRTVNGVTFCFYINDAGKMTSMPLAEFLAAGGHKVRSKPGTDGGVALPPVQQRQLRPAPDRPGRTGDGPLQGAGPRPGWAGRL